MNDWLTYNPTSGFGDATVTITAATSSALYDKFDGIVFSGTDIDISAGELVTLKGVEPPKPEPTAYTEYFTIETLSEADYSGVTWTAVGSNPNFSRTLQYSLNNGDWTEFTVNASGYKFVVPSGSTIRFRGANTSYADEYNSITLKNSTVDFSVRGNIMSLLYGSNFSTATTLPADYTFKELFSGCTGLTSILYLKLPAFTLTKGCYQQMFDGCTAITTTPTLPATELAYDCYYGMFNNCKSLITAPALPVKKLKSRCYSSMFSGCKSLQFTPTLPATDLVKGCYYGMFAGCTNLTSVTDLPAEIVPEEAYAYMFHNCTSLVKAPVLPAKVLSYKNCYAHMFDGCTSLNYIKSAAEFIRPWPDNANGATKGWVNDVSPTGTFEKNANFTGWTSGVNGIPNGWDREEVTVDNMFYSFTSSQDYGEFSIAISGSGISYQEMLVDGISYTGDFTGLTSGNTYMLGVYNISHATRTIGTSYANSPNYNYSSVANGNWKWTSVTFDGSDKIFYVNIQ